MGYLTPLVSEEEIDRLVDWKRARRDVKASIGNYVLQCLTIQACSMALSPVKNLVILNSLNERCHVVFFQPHGHIIKQADLDPVIPLTIFNLGNRYAWAMRGLVWHLLLWDDRESYDWQRTWTGEAIRLVREVRRALWSTSVRLESDEKHYLEHYLNLSIAAPHGGIQEKQVEWLENRPK